MKPWFLVLVAACSSGREDKRSAPATDQKPGAITDDTRQSIDVKTTDPAIAIRGVEVVPSARMLGVLEVGYRAESSGPAVIAEVTCRIGGYNLTYPATPRANTTARQTAQFRPDPFKVDADACEIAFYANTVDHKIASACYTNGVLVAGACAAGTFPPPPRRSRFDIELAFTSLELRDSTAVVTSLWTLAVPLEPGRHFAGQIRCADPAGMIAGEAAVPFLPLERMPAGSSIFGPIVIPLDRMPAAGASCQLMIVSRPTTPPLDEMNHGTYCVTPTGTLFGPCAPT